MIEDDLSASPVRLRREIRNLRKQLLEPPDPLKKWRRKGDSESIMPEILAARCLGIEYGDPGPKAVGVCVKCYEDRLVWYGNGWGLRHKGSFLDCRCECHEGEVLLAAA